MLLNYESGLQSFTTGTSRCTVEEGKLSLYAVEKTTASLVVVTLIMSCMVEY